MPDCHYFLRTLPPHFNPASFSRRSSVCLGLRKFSRFGDAEEAPSDAFLGAKLGLNCLLPPGSAVRLPTSFSASARDGFMTSSVLAEFAKAPNSAAVATNRTALSIPHRLFFSNLVLDHVPGRLLALHKGNLPIHHFL